MRKIVPICILMISLSCYLAADHFPLEFSLFNQAVREPMECIGLNPLHPGISMGTEFTYTQGRLGLLFQRISLGYYANKYSAKSLFLQTAAGYRYTLGMGLFADLTVGLGYLYSFRSETALALTSKEENDSDMINVNGAVIFSTSFGMGYDFSKKMGWPLSIFIRYEPYIQSPYSDREPELLQGMFHFGIRVQIP